MAKQATEVDKTDADKTDVDKTEMEEAAESADAEGAEEPEKAPAAASDADTKPSERSVDEKKSDAGKPRARAVAGAVGHGAVGRGAVDRMDPLRVTAIVVTLIAAIAAAWSGWSWYGAKHDDSIAYSAARDDVLQSGEQAIQNLNTLDYRSLDKSLQTWVDSSTGDLQRDITQGRAGFEQKMREAQTVSTAKVLEGAVTELDDRSGKARVIVGVEVTVTPSKGDPVVKRNRLIGELTRTRAGWKLSAVAPAPVGNA